MEGQNHLGIYLSKDTATVVCLGGQGKDRKLMGCFSVSVEEAEGLSFRPLAGLIAEGCEQRQLKFSGVAVALDCSMFMQHKVHSEFEDPKQIGATVRFDTEEALATDITDVAIAFGIISSDQSGSHLTVFTARRKILTELISSLQVNNMDPVTIEPDINCLSRFISRNVSLSDESRPFFCVLSQKNAYLIRFSKPWQASAMRTLLLSSTVDRNKLLAREVSVTAALDERAEPINCLRVFDSTDSVNRQRLCEVLGIEVDGLDLAAAVSVEQGALRDCSGPVDFSIAYGAALSYQEKLETINFRSDFMPYQGKKLRLQKALKFASCCISILILAVGVYFQVQLLQRNKYRGQLRDKFEKEYSAVMFGKKPPAKTNPAKKLAGELRRIRDVKNGQLSVTGEESVAAKLTLVLEAFNRCAAQTGLSIDTVSITAKSISIAGNTSSRRNTLKLFEAVKKSRLEIQQQRLSTKAGRDNFSITVVPKG